MYLHNIHSTMRCTRLLSKLPKLFTIQLLQLLRGELKTARVGIACVDLDWMAGGDGGRDEVRRLRRSEAPSTLSSFINKCAMKLAKLSA